MMDSHPSECWEDFASLLIDLLPADSQRTLDQIALLRLQTGSEEPHLKSQDCRIAVAELEGYELKLRHLNEKLDLTEAELRELRTDLETMDQVDVKELEAELIKISSDVNLYQMKVDEYGDVTVPETTSLSELKALRREVDELRDQVDHWKREGSLYEGIGNFQTDHLRRLVREKEDAVRKLTEEIATKAETRRSLI